MTSQKTFKRRVRARAAKTGESFTAARVQLLTKSDRNGQAPEAPPPDAAEVVQMPVSETALVKATGHGWEHWFALLDAWGGTQRTHTEIAAHVHDVLGVPSWWSQGVTVGFERARGMRALYQRGGEGFSVNASFTVSVPIERVSAAFMDEAQRARWLPDGTVKPRSMRPNKGATFDFLAPPSRVMAWLLAKGPSKTQAGVEHSRLPSARSVEEMRAFWRARFSELKAQLEG
jgi:hypothetical protein